MQTRKQSLFESIINTSIGVILSVTITQTVGVYVLNIPIGIHQNIELCSIITIVSLLRGYLVRRYFNKKK